MNKLFRIERKDFSKIIYILGCRFTIKNRKKRNIARIVQRVGQENMAVFALHQKTFLPFKCLHHGQDIVIFASGPTAKNYIPIKDAVHIGINRSFEAAPVELDYIFAQDYTGKTPEYIDLLDVYAPQKCKKFYGIIRENVFEKAWTIPETHAIKADAFRYRTDWTPFFKPEFAFDISTQALGDFGSTVFSALQFALWTYPQKIYLVGCDCTTEGYSYNSKEKNFLATDKVIKAYAQFKQFAQKHYPDVEIISINPVGLKGIFKDEYQGEKK